MPIVSFICLVVFFLFLFSGLRKDAKFLSPGRIFGMLWAFVIGLVPLKLSRLQFQWSGLDWFMVLIGLITFLIGTYVSFIINLNKPLLKVSEIRIKIREEGLNETKLFRFIVAYFIIFVFCFVVEWQLEGFLPLFTSNPGKARMIYGIFGLHLIVSSANVILFLIVEYYIFIKANIKKKVMLAFFLIIAMGNYILIVQRYGLFILVMMAFCFFYFSGKKIKPRTIIIFASIVILVVAGIQSLRETELATQYILLGSKMKSKNYSGFAIPYMYLVMNVENFAKYYSHIEHYSYGFFSVDFLTALTGLKHWIEEYFNFSKFRYYIGGYNTYPFYWAYYYDFGLAGLAIVPFILGYGFSEIYYYLHKKPNLVILVLYSVIFSVIVISYSSDPLTRLDMMFNYIIIVFAQFYFMNNKSNKYHQIRI